MKPISQMTIPEILDLLKTIKRGTWVKVGLALIAILAFVCLFVYPAWIERIELKNKIKTLELRKASYVNLERAKPKMMEERKKASEFIDSVKKRLYAPAEASLLLGAIARLANDAKVSIIASTPRESEKDFPAPYNQQYQAALYDFTVEGGYHNIGKFIASLEANEKLLRVQKFLITSKEPSKDVQLAELTLTATSRKS